MKTFMANASTVTRNWYIVDAKGKTLGRLATQVASVLKGKTKPYYTPHYDCGDYVIVINAEKINLTGNKWKDKIYYSYSGYNGGLSETSAENLLVKFPTRLVEKAVVGMLPHGILGRDQARKLFVYAGENHPHQAQQPQILEV